ncbi:MAG: hypothetical protein WHU94_15425 [Thermogemmata sp.]|uniref:Uncharacterized protein n=1 Tax=Thermogemmata fonticola TaxID=2755323 RepID=A0A7V8VFA6_9BACT|nr:hypothetical protein [Thermogemmata fonticola]MBA2226970.1 hypothetical protein [Thermogemmata fonticola]
MPLGQAWFLPYLIEQGLLQPRESWNAAKLSARPRFDQRLRVRHARSPRERDPPQKA